MQHNIATIINRLTGLLQRRRSKTASSRQSGDARNRKGHSLRPPSINHGRRMSRRRRAAANRNNAIVAQHLESRVLLASVMDDIHDSDTLSIELAENESLDISTDGSSYTFVSDSQPFADTGISDVADFTGFGTSTLMLTDLAQHTSIRITDSAAGAQVRFIDSGSNAYVHDLKITFDDHSFAQSVVFSGATSLGNSDIFVATDSGIVLVSGANLTTVDGNINLTGNNSTDETDALRGIELVGASIATTGIGNIRLIGTGTGEGALSHHRIGISLEADSTISSTASGGDAGRINLTGIGGNGDGFNYGVLFSTGTQISSVDGNISITGVGGNGSGPDNKGVVVEDIDVIESNGTGQNAATIEINGSGGSSTVNSFGVHILGNTTSVQSVDGDISITAQGGNSSGNRSHGVQFTDGMISSTGTGTDAAAVTIAGQGGAGVDSNLGILMDSAATVSTSMGDVMISGTGGDAIGSSNHGIRIGGASQVVSTGVGPTAGTILINGVGGTGTDLNIGLAIDSDSDVRSVDGDVSLTGQGGTGSGSDNRGVSLNDFGAIESTGSGADAAGITVTGVGGSGNGGNGILLRSIQSTAGQIHSSGDGPIQLTATGTGTFDALLVEEQALIGGNSATGDITITADSIGLDDTAVIQSTGALIIAPNTSGTSIGLGGGTGTLNLSDAVLATLQDGFSAITIGNLQNGAGDVSVDSVAFLDPVTIAGGRITDSADVDIVAVTVSLAGAVNPGPTDVNNSTSPGVLQINGDVALAENSVLEIEISGTTPGNTHDQLTATGNVNIGANAALQTMALPSWTPMPNDSLVIVQRSGGTGTFVDLPEGATVPEFFNATISYVGGDGNDIVLTLPETIPPAVPGNVDGDTDFDANDSFLIHLVKLSGTNAQIENARGSSQFTAAEIRQNVNQIGLAADVDGDGDFDANDSFLIHLVKLSGNDSQIDGSKGSSLLTAAEIRANADSLGPATTNSANSRRAWRSWTTDTWSLPQPDLFQTEMPPKHGASAALQDEFASDSASAFSAQDFRHWIDSI